MCYCLHVGNNIKFMEHSVDTFGVGPLAEERGPVKRTWANVRLQDDSKDGIPFFYLFLPDPSVLVLDDDVAREAKRAAQEFDEAHPGAVAKLEGKTLKDAESLLHSMYQ